MVDTPNLAITHVTATQSNKEVTINDAFNALDAALTEPQVILIDSSNTHTIITTDLQGNVLFDLKDDPTPPTADITLTIPALKRGIFAVRNNTTQTVNVSISGQSEPAVAILSGSLVHIDSDGVDVKAPTTSSGAGTGGTDGWENVEFKDVSDVANLDIAIPSGIIAQRLVGWAKPISDGSELLLRFSVDTGASFDAGAGQYSWVDPRLRAGTGQIIDSSASDTSIRLATDVGNAAGEKVSFDIIIVDPRSIAEFTYVINDNARLKFDPVFEAGYGGGVYLNAADADFLRLFWNSGNITAKIMVQKLSDTV